jgi:epoxyqueuosine reductase
LTLSLSEARKIIVLARETGFSRAGFVDPRALGNLAPRQFPAHGEDGLEWSWVASPEEWREMASILVCCLSCHRREPDDLSTPGDPHGLIAPFARRNHYRTAARMMHTLLGRVEAELGIRRKSARIFCNSRIPEKPLCAAAGLAWLGNNGLCIAPGLGSLFIIAGAVIPRPLPDVPDPVARLENACGACRKCVTACPTGAITSPGTVDPAKCLQGLAASPKVLSSEVMGKWGARLYGCQDCQAVCPHNRGLSEEGAGAEGEIGPSLSLRRFLSLDDASVERFFQGTAMGLTWISKEALRRNAIIAAGSRGSAVLRESVAPYVQSDSPALSAAARWALDRMSG